MLGKRNVILYCYVRSKKLHFSKFSSVQLLIKTKYVEKLVTIKHVYPLSYVKYLHFFFLFARNNYITNKWQMIALTRQIICSDALLLFWLDTKYWNACNRSQRRNTLLHLYAFEMFHEENWNIIEIFSMTCFFIVNLIWCIHVTYIKFIITHTFTLSCLQRRHRKLFAI